MINKLEIIIKKENYTYVYLEIGILLSASNNSSNNVASSVVGTNVSLPADNNTVYYTVENPVPTYLNRLDQQEAHILELPYRCIICLKMFCTEQDMAQHYLTQFHLRVIR